MSDVLIGLVGDVLVNRDDPLSVFKDVADILKVPDILFGHLEGGYSDHPYAVPGAGLVVGAPVHNLDVYAQAGFSVVSLAGNHVLDMGYTAMLETRARLRAQGIQTCGVGASEADARAPAILERKGLRVAFLAYASVFPMGYEAQGNRAGLAPVRSYNFWREPFPNYYQPGCPPALISVPDQSDFASLAEDIRRARERADLVIASFHWGDYSRPFYLTEHERSTARFCIDHGVDMVIGHHHHTLRGIEWYQGKPIMYGLGHLVADIRAEIGDEVWKALLSDGGEEVSYRVGPREGWPLLPLHKDSRMALIAWARATRSGISDIAVLPCHLTPDGLVHPLRMDSQEGKEVIAYLEKCNRTQGLAATITLNDTMPIRGSHALRVRPS